MDHVVDKLVGQDGSTYVGTTKHGLPSGLGTCMWPDGSQYDGEWREGTMHGFGTYVWRSGQRYDGEWKDGKRDGIGIKTYADGSMYDGFWRDGKKHGLGVFRPAPEDANSRRHSLGWPSQPPTMQGQPAAAAAAAGQGASVAAPPCDADIAESGPPSPELRGRQQQQQQQQQQQDQEVPPSLNRTLSDQPQASSLTAANIAAARAADRSELPNLKHSISIIHPVPSTGSIAPPDVSVASPSRPAGTAAQPASSSVAAAGNSGAPLRLYVHEYDSGRLLRQDPLSAEEIRMIFGFLWAKKPNKVRRRVQRVLGRAPRLQRKLGEVVYKGHYSWELMIALQLGIRYSVGRTDHMLRPGSISRSVSGAPAAAAAGGSGASSSGAPGGLSPSDFAAAAKFTFPSCGSSTTPAHPSMDFKWKDYTPGVFKQLRKVFAVDEAEYMLSLAGSQALRQLNSPGKSGSIFFLSEDEKYLVKTMRKSEMKVLLELLPKYCDHVTKYPNTLITRFFGLHRVTPLHGRSVRFVVMANIFVTDLLIHRRYDIKGSTDGRTVGPAAKVEGDPNVILKDLDIDMRLQLDPAGHDAVMNQLQADCELLRDVGVMDYSLLLGVHYPNRVGVTRAHGDLGMSSDGGGYDSSTAAGPGMAGSRALRTTISDDDSQYEGTSGAGYRGAPAVAISSSNGPSASAAAPAMGTVITGQNAQEQLSATLLLTSAIAGCRTTSDGTDLPGPPLLPSADSSGSGSGQLQQQHSNGGAAPKLLVAGPLESLPETAVFQAPAAGASAAGTSSSAGTGSGAAPPLAGAQGVAGEVRIMRVTSDGEGAGAGGPRNWDVYTGQAELEERLAKIVARMRKMNFSEQRMKDIAELARLKILGSKLKKSATRREPPSAVLQAIQQQRQEHQSSGGAATTTPMTSLDAAATPGVPSMRLLQHLKSLRGAFAGIQAEEEEEDPVIDAPLGAAPGLEQQKQQQGGAPPQLGINMLALAVPNDAPEKAQEAIVCFGIIDILQDYSARKIVERRFKTITHDGDAVSVAPPKKYARRFLEFVRDNVFVAPPGAKATSAAAVTSSGTGSISSMAGIKQQQQQQQQETVPEAWGVPGATAKGELIPNAVSHTTAAVVAAAPPKGGLGAVVTGPQPAAAADGGRSSAAAAVAAAAQADGSSGGSGTPTGQQVPIAVVVSAPAAKDAAAGPHLPAAVARS